MVRISVKEARQRFRDLLDRVEQGEEVIVLRRGKAVARLVPDRARDRRLPDLGAFRSAIGEQGTSSAELLREERDAR